MSSTEVQRPTPPQSITPFWPTGRARLIVNIVPSGGKLAVTGFDPDKSMTSPVFSASIETTQDAAFLEAVRVGTGGDEVANDNQPPGAANTIVVSDPGGGGDGGGPKFWKVSLTAGLVAKTASKARPTGT